MRERPLVLWYRCALRMAKEEIMSGAEWGGRGWTPEMIRELPEDGSRYECVSGALLVTPAPSWTHQRAAGRLYARVLDYVTEHAIGDALMAPADIELGPNLVEPDVFVVP